MGDKEILKISIFKEDLNNTSFYIYGYCSELYRMTFHEKVIKRHFVPLLNTFYYSFPVYTCKKRYCYSFSLLKYRYEISIVDISTLLKNIDIDMEKLKILILISISISIR